MPPSPADNPASSRETALANQLARLVGGGLAAASGFATLASWVVLQSPAATGIAAIGLLNSLAMAWAGRRGVAAPRILGHLALYGALGAAYYAVIDSGVVTLVLPALLLAAAAPVRGPRQTLGLTAALIAMHLAASGLRYALLDPPVADILMLAAMPPTMLAVLAGVVLLLDGRSEIQRREIAHRLSEIEAVIPAVQRLAHGDLTGRVEGMGPLAHATRQTQEGLAELARQLQHNAATLQSVAAAVDQMAVGQAARTRQLSESAGSIQEAGRSVLERARKVTGMARQVARAAEESTAATQVSSERLAALTRTARRVSQHHLAIKRIASKSEILAVNAAIEAAHAGAAGRAFSQVAARLQALAEAVHEQLDTAETLQAELARAARQAIEAAERSTQATDQSAALAGTIASVAADQLQATERFSEAVAEIESTSALLRDDSGAARSQVEQLVDVAEQLTTEVQRFQLPPSQAPGPADGP